MGFMVVFDDLVCTNADAADLIYLTSKDDDSVGEAMDGSSGNPEREPCTFLAGGTSGSVFQRMVFGYAVAGICGTGGMSVRHCTFTGCDIGIDLDSGELELHSVDFWGGQNCEPVFFTGDASETFTLNAGNVTADGFMMFTVLPDDVNYANVTVSLACCTITTGQDIDAWGQAITNGGGTFWSGCDPNDVDGDGLPDWWERQNFGNLDQDPGDDPDHDGLSNLQEYQMHTDPTVPNPPAISIQPASQAVVAGDSVSFRVTPTGAVLSSYGFQWQRYGTNLAGETGISLTLNNVQAGDAGDYSVVVSNIAGSTNSTIATLSVLAITSQPVSVITSLGGGAVFSVSATGTSPLAYQWRKNGYDLADGGNVSGATNATLTLTNLTLSDAGIYDVVVSDVAGSLGSALAVLRIWTPACVVAWGENYYTPVPPCLTNAVAVAGGFAHGLALRDDGTMVAWGGCDYAGEPNVTGGANERGGHCRRRVSRAGAQPRRHSDGLGRVRLRLYRRYRRSVGTGKRGGDCGGLLSQFGAQERRHGGGLE